MRITSGQWRGRQLLGPEDTRIRPTSDKVRQAVFNMLASRDAVVDAVVLDLFCGTGALGLEALSRGAKQAHLVDSHIRSLALARQNAKALGAAQISFQQSDASKLPARAIDLPPATLVFIDPPYKQGLVEPALALLVQGGWLADTCWVLAETESQIDLALPDGFTLETSRDHGDTRVHLLYYTQN